MRHERKEGGTEGGKEQDMRGKRAKHEEEESRTREEESGK